MTKVALGVISTMTTDRDVVDRHSDILKKDRLLALADSEGYPSFYPDEKSYDDWEREFLHYLSFDIDPSEKRDWYVSAGFREETVDLFVHDMPGAEKVDPVLERKEFRGSDTDDPDELKRICREVESDLWWANDDCNRLIRKIDGFHIWNLIQGSILVICAIAFAIGLTVGPAPFCVTSSIVVGVVTMVFYIGSVSNHSVNMRTYSARQFQKQVLMAELQYVEKRIEDVG